MDAENSCDDWRANRSYLDAQRANELRGLFNKIRTRPKSNHQVEPIFRDEFRKYLNRAVLWIGMADLCSFKVIVVTIQAYALRKVYIWNYRWIHWLFGFAHREGLFFSFFCCKSCLLGEINADTSGCPCEQTYP